MVKFLLESSCSAGRLGVIEQWGSKPIDHATPSCALYVRAGHVPHLTWDVMQKQVQLLQKPICQLALPTVIESARTIKKFQQGVAAFCGMKDHPIHLSTFDALDQLRSGFNDTNSVSVFAKGGKILLNAYSQHELVKSFKVDSFETLFDYDVAQDVTAKRMSKAMERTRNFVEKTFEYEEQLAAPVFVSLAGGLSAFERRKCAVDNGRRCPAEPRFAGYNIDLHDFWHGAPFDLDLLKKILHETFEPLPASKLRIVCGPFSPTQVFHLTKLGIDLFDSSFAVKMAEEAKAFRIRHDFATTGEFETLDFTQDEYKEDFTTLFAQCNCYTCKNYTKGYLHHLHNTKELLRDILLVIHNLTEYERMFAVLREHIVEVSKS